MNLTVGLELAFQSLPLQNGEQNYTDERLQ